MAQEDVALTIQPALLLDDPWRVEASGFPERASAADKLAFLLNYAALAPSILNTEPWSFRIAGDAVRLYADLSRKLPVTDPKARELTMSCGAALLNLRIAAQSFGHELVVSALPDKHQPDLLAEAALRPAPDAGKPALREAIVARRTNRGPFADRRLPKKLLDALAEAARQEGAALAFLDDPEGKEQVSQLAAEAEQVLLANPAFRDEIAQWIEKRVGENHDRDSEARQRLAVSLSGGSGHTPESTARPELFASMAAGAARVHGRGEDAEERQRRRVEGSPMLALLTTKGDGHAEWLAAGQALQRVLLVATEAGASAAYLNPAIEVASLRSRVAKAFDVAGSPQVLLRLGYGTQRPATPRRPVREIVASIGDPEA